MQKGLHINVFDFDETLFRVPGYTCSEARGMTPYEWFDSPVSLSESLNIVGIGNIIDRTRDAYSNYLVTHRVKECEDRVLEILRNHEIEFDKCYLLGRGSEKAELVSSLISENDAESITIFEDSLWEVIKYTLHFVKSEMKAKVEFVFVDKSRIITIDWETAKVLANDVQVDKLRLS
jgi:hypothetical protein